MAFSVNRPVVYSSSSSHQLFPARSPSSLSYHGLRLSKSLPSPSFHAQFLDSARLSLSPSLPPRPCFVFCSAGMNIVFVSAEVAPWSKTGGLGDVLGGLPPALAARGHRVMTIAPRYDQYKDAWDTDVVVEIQVGNKIEPVRFFHTYKRGVDRVFVDHPIFLAKVWGKTGSKIYGPMTGEDYPDNELRFSLFALAAIEAARTLSLSSSDTFSGPYGEDVVFVANDWHTALIPCYLKSKYQSRGLFKNAKVHKNRVLERSLWNGKVCHRVESN